MTEITVEPIKTTVVRWKCPHCNRHLSRRRKAVEHVDRCFLNPTNRTCRTCVHHRFEESEPETGWHLPEHCEADVEPEQWPVVNCPLWKLAGGED